MSQKEIYNSSLVQHLLNQLPQGNEDNVWELSFPISKKFEDNGKFIIAGYASVEVIDSQDELIPIPVIKEAWEQFRANKDFYFGSLMHSNVPVIKILDSYKDHSGEEWKSRVDENGLFIVAEVRQDIEKGKQTWELIQKGKLTGFSIGGEALASTEVCEGKCFTRIDKMELHEIAVVDRPANAPSVFTILKRDVKKESKVEKFIITKEMTEEDLRKKIEALIKERERLEKIAYHTEKTPEQKKADMEIQIIYSQINAIESALGEKMINKTMESSIEKLDIALKRLIGKPFAGYDNFKDCEAQNSGKKDPAAYCATVQREVEKLDSKIEKKAGIESIKEKLMKLEEERIIISGLANPVPSIQQTKARSDLEILDIQINAIKNELKRKSEELKLKKAEEGSTCIIKCPVDDTINKATFKKLDDALDLFLKRE